MEQLRPNPLIRRFDHATSNNFHSSRNVRRRTFSEGVDNSEALFTSKSLTEGKYRYQRDVVSDVIDYSIANLMEQLEGDSMYGSVTEEIKALFAKRQEILNPLRKLYPSLFNYPGYSVEQSPRGGRGTSNVASQGVIDLVGEDELHDLGPEIMETPVGQIVSHTPDSNNAMVLADSDGRFMIGNNKPDYSYDLEVSKMRRDPNYCGIQIATDAQRLGSQLRTPYNVEQRRRKNSTTQSDNPGTAPVGATTHGDNQGTAPVGPQMRTSYDFQSLFLKKPVGPKPRKDINGRDRRKMNIEKEDKGTICGETVIEKSKGVYVGVQDDVMGASGSGGGEDDGLGDIWMEMNLALECSKDASSALGTATEHTAEDEEEDECEHSFVLKDDLGYVCRICGVIEKSIEQIFDFQWGKGTKTTRTSHMSQSRTAKDSGQVEGSQFTIANATDQDFGVAEISVHPRHMKQMKPHQIEGFNFLLRNLVCDSPGGCILAHAPGSGKTFMIISFMQSFLAKYPNARPLVVLPKGILATWKREFERWQVEEIPLYDLYTSKADGRAQQLDVLKQWVEHRGILFLGYKQFASIVSNSTSSVAAAACHDILLKVPTILILDEGHTPRNDTTDMVYSLSQVQTPRKVVLSGTLFQNHVKEVFNILNLVRPKFLKLDTSKSVVRRVMSRVQISVGKQIKSSARDTTFYDLVEETLHNDQDFRRKVTVIQDLREMTAKVLHYYKGDFLDELPGLVDLTVLLTLNPKQKPAVEELRNMDKFKKSSMGSAVYIHPQLKEHAKSCNVGEKGHINEAKIDELLNKLEFSDGVKAKFFMTILALCESAGEKMLVFSQYLLPLKFLERLVVKIKGWSLGKEIFVLSGDSSQDQREISMERFNNSKDAKVFFGSIKACGEGISLVGASRLLILDIHLNPSVTRQAIGRAFRPGQTRKVYAYRLVAADSPEEEDHHTSFRKELISKMWFEWNEICGYHDFAMEEVNMKDLDDSFWNKTALGEDVKALYKR